MYSIDIGDQEMNVLANIGEALPSLELLYLMNNKIGDDGMTAFSTAIARNALPSLKKLFLHINEIGDMGMERFGEALCRGGLHSLSMLDLSMNQIGDAGIKKFTDFLMKSNRPLPSLTYLNLRGNKLSDDSMKALTVVIESTALPSLNILLVDDETLGTGHLQLIAACKKRNVAVK